MARVTIILPTYNEIKRIGEIQNQIRNLRGDYELIFTDGFSQDGTYEAIDFPKIQETKYRAMQMNAGAKYAKTEYLWFVHADSKLHPDSIKAIEESGLDVGCFRIRFGSNHPLMLIEQWFSNLRVSLRKIAFGDQGIFIKRELFEEIGGYKEIPLMEDYQLSIDLKARGIYPKLVNLPIWSSPIRFKKNGIIRNIIKMQYLQSQYRKGADIWEIAEKYNK